MTLTRVRPLATDRSAMYRFYRDGLGLQTTWDESPGYAELDAAPGIEWVRDE